MTQEHDDPRRNIPEEPKEGHEDPADQRGADEARRDAEDQPMSVEDELVGLAQDLGFVESDALRSLRLSMSPDMPEQHSAKLLGEYQNQARVETPAGSDPPGSNIVLAVNIAGVAAILRSGRIEDAYEELNTVIMLAENQQQNEIADYLADLQASL